MLALGLQVAGKLAVCEASTSTDRAIPKAIGRYRIIRLLGEGGMGVVYEAEQPEPRRRVALKVISQGVVSAATLRRFEHEAEMLARLEHPRIARLLA